MSAILTTHFRQFFSTDQHDFVKGRSTVTNLIEFTNQAITVVESGEQMGVVFTDI